MEEAYAVTAPRGIVLHDLLLSGDVQAKDRFHDLI